MGGAPSPTLLDCYVLRGAEGGRLVGARSLRDGKQARARDGGAGEGEDQVLKWQKSASELLSALLLLSWPCTALRPCLHVGCSAAFTAAGARFRITVASLTQA